MMRKLSAGVALCAVAALVFACAAAAQAAAVKVELVKKGDGWQLMRDGKPYFIKGAGGDASKAVLAECGGNSFRTWGFGNDTQGQLDEAQKLGLAVCAGTWLGHTEHGFSYTNEKQLADQKARVEKEIEKFKDHPAVLCWALGNEMENGVKAGADSEALWKHVQELAAMAHKLDPNHPTMTIVAEIGGDKIPLIHKLCPDIDIIGINSYAGASSIAERYKKLGGTKAYAITEFGPPGVWEWQKNDQGAVLEPNSSEKAKWYKNAYTGSIADQPLCVGSYAFAWGSKQEATATWYGLILPDGSRVEAVDVLQELWTGKAPEVKAPVVKAAKLDAPTAVAPGAAVKASVEIVDPQNLPLTYKWILYKDPQNYNTGGGTQAAPPSYPDAIAKSDAATVEVKMPSDPAAYRLFLYAYNGKQRVATANFPVKVSASAAVSAATSAMTPEEKEKMKPVEVKFPFAIYAEGQEKWPYNPTGFMPEGIDKVMTLDAKCTDNPHSGKTCMKIVYGDTKGWGGIVWQNPDNDWGKLAGGYNLSGAKVLSFWARGDKGGEKVSFSFGLLTDKDKNAYYDTDHGDAKDVILTKNWHPYFIYLDDKDLSRIKTAFVIVTGANAGKPTTFYLSDIVYSAGGEAIVVTPKGEDKKADEKKPDPTK